MTQSRGGLLEANPMANKERVRWFSREPYKQAPVLTARQKRRLVKKLERKGKL